MTNQSAIDPPQKTRRYFSQLVSFDQDLFLIIIAAVLFLIIINVPYVNNTVVRSAFALFFFIFIPGYAFTAALYPRKEDLTWLGRLVLSVVFSVTIVPFIGVGFNYTPWGIQQTSTTVIILFLTVGSSAVAFKRRSSVPQEARFSITVQKMRTIRDKLFPASQTRVNKILNLVLVLAILTSAMGLTYVLVTPRNGERYTELYILGPQGKAYNYPLEFTLGEQKSVVVGVGNREQQDQSYRLVVQMNNSGQVETLYSGKMTIPSDQVWEQAVNLKPSHTGSNMKLQFLLYLDDDNTTPYREVHSWANVTASK